MARGKNNRKIRQAPQPRRALNDDPEVREALEKARDKVLSDLAEERASHNEQIEVGGVAEKKTLRSDVGNKGGSIFGGRIRSTDEVIPVQPPERLLANAESIKSGDRVRIQIKDSSIGYVVLFEAIDWHGAQLDLGDAITLTAVSLSRSWEFPTNRLVYFTAMPQWQPNYLVDRLLEHLEAIEIVK